MEPISKHLPEGPRIAPDKRGPTSHRAELLGYFIDKVNEYRARDGFKLMAPRAVAVLLSHLTIDDLYYLKSVCESSKNWSKKFWWSIKNH